VTAEDELLAELRALRDRVMGVTDTALASRDGLIIVADTGDLDPDSMAALGAASLGLAQRMAAEVGKGLLRQAVTRSNGGYVAIYAVGSGALLMVVADVGVDVMRLDREATATAEVIDAIRTGQSRTRDAGRAAAGLSHR
jgi:predicted regulator of Ras-like GTPase activity (Roadblock/LC7/MglB family)